MSESEIYTFISFTFHFVLFHFKCTFLSLESMCQRKIKKIMLYILMNNKGLFDLRYIYIYFLSIPFFFVLFLNLVSANQT